MPAMRLPSLRLYWRIFLLLLVAQVLIAGGSVLLTLAVNRAVDPSPTDWPALARDAGVAFRDGGAAGLRDWQKLQYRTGVAAFLVDGEGRSVDGDLLPPPLVHWILMTPGDGLVDRDGPPGRREVQVPVPDDVLAGHRLVAMVDQESARRSQAVFRLGSAAIVAVVLIAIITLFLTRSLVRPILDLRSVTRSVAAGAYSKRVGVGALSRQDELGELAADFDAMAERVQAQFEAQRQLFRDVSHELKSPLARLQLAIELLREDSPDERQQRWLPRLDKEAHALSSMLDRILVLAQVDPGATEIRKGEVDLEALVESLVEDARFEAAKKGQAVEFASTGPAIVSGSQTLLTSAVENVIRNAVHYGRPDSAVSVALTVADGRATVTVGNRGESLRASDLQRIFEPFYRVPGARIGGPAGQGIGLAITRNVAQAHQGSVVAANHPEGGVIVKLTLPLHA